MGFGEADLPLVATTSVAAEVDDEELLWYLATHRRAYSSPPDLNPVTMGSGMVGEEDDRNAEAGDRVARAQVAPGLGAVGEDDKDGSPIGWRQGWG